MEEAGAAAALPFAGPCTEIFPQANSSCILKEQNKGAGINSPFSKAIFLSVLNVFSNYEFLSKEVDRVAPGNVASAPEEPEPPAAVGPSGSPSPSSAQAREVDHYFAFWFYKILNL